MLVCLHRSVEDCHVIFFSVQKCWKMTTFVVALYCNRIHVSNVIKIPISRLDSQYFLFHTNPLLISCFFPLQVLYSSPSHIHRNFSFSAMFSLLHRPHNPLLMSPPSPTILTNQKTFESLRADDGNYQFYLSLKKAQILYLQCLKKGISGYEFPHGKAAVKWAVWILSQHELDSGVIIGGTVEVHFLVKLFRRSVTD